MAVAAILGTGLAGRPARAEPGADAGAHQHHGIFLRFLVGPAGLTNTVPSGSADGAGAGVALAVGSAVTRSLVFYGEASYVFVTESASTSEVGTRFETLGPGLIYYFPSSLYLGTSIFFADGSFAGTGLGASETVGKEWWVSDRWALGLAGRISILERESSEGAWSIDGGAMIAFSASYN